MYIAAVKATVRLVIDIIKLERDLRREGRL
jgi:hypothetical protein